MIVICIHNITISGYVASVPSTYGLFFLNKKLEFELIQRLYYYSNIDVDITRSEGYLKGKFPKL